MRSGIGLSLRNAPCADLLSWWRSRPGTARWSSVPGKGATTGPLNERGRVVEPIVVIGAGLAGCEAVWQIHRQGGRVLLYEMKPKAYSPAHHLPSFAEIVCSNSFKSESLENAHGLLKEELKQLDSLILRVARETRVRAGDSLTVDREAFSKRVTQILERLEDVEIIRVEVTELPEDRIVVVATGPLTSQALSQEIQKLTGDRHLFFFDAISPIVTAESIDLAKGFMASRYGKGGDDFLNCPMDKEEYDRFVEALRTAERTPVKDFEKRYLFEGCLPVEELADRGRETLAFGPLKPVGLIDPRLGRRPHAVVQLRREDRAGSCFNLVGFQTRLKQGEQKRVFRMIPGLERAEFLRWGSVHRNTFVDSPRLLGTSLQLRANPRLFLAGQITGVEGYVESTAMGLLAGINAYRFAKGMPLVHPPGATAMGALVGYITGTESLPFQPMNINFGLFPPLEARGRAKRGLLGERALEALRAWKETHGL
jgi:methylenetetrahydrofolate--tRNA-(uracil-5-)-methyltransferase